MDSATRLQKILVDSPIGVVLPAIAFLNLPNWWLAGGTLRNTVWRPLFGRPYSSTEDGVSDWLHTATAVGVRLDDGVEDNGSSLLLMV